MDSVEQTPGAWLGSGVAERADRRVHLREFAVVGAQSQRPAPAGRPGALLTDPDVAVILIGANDVTHTVLPAASVRFLSEAVRRLREADVAVVVGTCPDLGTVSPLPLPLRQVARVWSRRLAAAQTIAVVEAGGRTVSLGSILGPGVRGRTGAAVRARPVPPLRRRLRVRSPGCWCPRCSPRSGMGEEEEETPRVGRGEAVLPDRLRRGQGQPEPRHRDRRHRGRRRQARCRRTLGDPDAAPAAAHRRGGDAATPPARGQEHGDAPADESAEASA